MLDNDSIKAILFARGGEFMVACESLTTLTGEIPEASEMVVWLQ
jgi:hypothetical protein